MNVCLQTAPEEKKKEKNLNWELATFTALGEEKNKPAIEESLSTK